MAYVIPDAIDGPVLLKRIVPLTGCPAFTLTGNASEVVTSAIKLPVRVVFAASGATLAPCDVDVPIPLVTELVAVPGCV
jgi:hypothetical protein